MAPVACGQQYIPSPVSKIEYSCSSPSSQAALRKLQQPLPLQITPIANLEWAASFLDHAAHLIRDRDQKAENLAQLYKKAIATISDHNSTIERLRKDNATLQREVNCLTDDLAHQQSAYKRLNASFEHFRAQAKSQKDSLHKQVHSLTIQLHGAQAKVKALEGKLKAADKSAHDAWLKEREDDEVDHQFIRDQQQNIISLKDDLEQKVAELHIIQEKLHVAEDRLKNAEHSISELTATIESLKQDMYSKGKRIQDLEAELVQLRATNADLTRSRDAIAQELRGKTEQLHKSDEDLATTRVVITGLTAKIAENEDTILSLTGQLRREKDLHSQAQTTIDNLVGEINKALKSDLEKNAKIAELNELLGNADDQIKLVTATKAELLKKLNEVQDHDAEDHARLQLSQEANAKREAAERESAAKMQERIDAVQRELAEMSAKSDTLTRAAQDAQKAVRDINEQQDLAKKQAEEAEKMRESARAATNPATATAEATKEALPNTVKLSNPIALVGDLTGAPRNVDDEYFNINCPFPVTLFNVKSSKVFVSVNGLFTLEQPSGKYSYQKLPYWPWIPFNALPKCVLAPFWADLFIYKGTPQGVYYEVTGEKPQRKLEIEWYVSRYGDSTQYYQFSVAVEENKPNMATFKYFKAIDKGARCTVGVQGPNAASLFSYNEEKIVPGTQITFDTSMADHPTYKRSEMQEPKAVTKTISSVIDIKSPQSVTVNEIVAA